ncbi:MAG: GTPase HflX [Cellulosilyticum sp.]|nr:GTPase HflX [Cellulosilyticum sp.]
MIEHKEVIERFILVAAQKKQFEEKEAWESLEELKELVKTAGGEVIMEMLQRVDRINPGYYIGTGKVEEIRELITMHEATGVVFDDELSPIQMRNLAEALQVKVMDRTMIILDIFASRARSKEGKLQVEMAQLKYQSSRLIGFGTMLSRQAGGIGSRGPGEKKLELDKRHLRTRMEILEKELAEVEKHRQLIRDRRQKNSTPVVAIVGYTNAGKSTLLNKLSGSDVYVQNQLFATLDPTTRATQLPSGSEILLTDTVGFIRKLPHHLIKAFYSTLEEAKYADIILHVMDISSPHILTHQQIVYETLERLQIIGVPIISVYNKIDQFDGIYPKDEKADYEVSISAKTGMGCEQLLETVEQILYASMKPFEIEIPYSEGHIVRYCHEYGERLEEEYTNTGTHIKGFMPQDKIYKIEPWILS